MGFPSTVVLIDAGYLGKISKYFGNGKYLRLDLLKFSKHISIKQGLWFTELYYYHAPPHQSSTPTEDELRLKAGYDSFISHLSKHKEVTIREGRVQRIGSDFTQKGVDTLLTMDLMELALSKKYQTIIVLACDTDFVPVFNRIRKEHNVKIVLCYFTDRVRNSIFSMSNHILTACDTKVLLTKEHFMRNLRT